jgi:hypothetical protein
MNFILEADEGVRMVLASRVITDAPDKFLVLRHPSYPTGLEHPEWARGGEPLHRFAAAGCRHRKEKRRSKFILFSLRQIP